MNNIEERMWCIVCGYPRGDCKHTVGFTTDADKAKDIYLIEKRREREKKQYVTMGDLLSGPLPFTFP